MEHLTLALIDDANASAVMTASGVDRATLKQDLESYIAFELKALRTVDNRDTSPTAAFRRVVYRATVHAKGLNRETSGADVLAAMFDQTESPAVWLLSEHGMSKFDIRSNWDGMDREDRH